MNNSHAQVVIESLSVCYPGGIRALIDVDLTITTGLFGLLGPNGAGKTTLMRTLATLQKPTGGKAWVYGCDVERQPGAVRQLLGLSPPGFP